MENIINTLGVGNAPARQMTWEESEAMIRGTFNINAPPLSFTSGEGPTYGGGSGGLYNVSNTGPSGFNDGYNLNAITIDGVPLHIFLREIKAELLRLLHDKSMRDMSRCQLENDIINLKSELEEVTERCNELETTLQAIFEEKAQ